MPARDSPVPVAQRDSFSCPRLLVSAQLVILQIVHESNNFRDAERRIPRWNTDVEILLAFRIAVVSGSLVSVREFRFKRKEFNMRKIDSLICIIALSGMSVQDCFSQEKSVKPGINAPFRDPDVKEFQGKFEVESREVFARRNEIVKACKIKPGMTIADIGAGTGLFTRLFSEATGPEGRVVAVDIARKFLDHIEKNSRESGQRNVETLLCTADSTELPPDSIDLAYICDTYHHFEFPNKTMTSLFLAMKPGGRVIVIDFRRVKGESSDWVMNHVRAGQEVFESEIKEAGFRKIEEDGKLLKENYFVVFEKPAKE